MRIGIIGAGHIGGNAGQLFVRAGHEVLFSFARDQAKLDQLAAATGPQAGVGTPRQAVEFGEVVMLAVPWTTIDAALAAAGDLTGKIVIDTTNQFGPGGVVTPPDGLSAAAFNARRMPGARLVKAYNTLTAGFQAQTAGRQGSDRVVLFYAGEDAEAKRVVAQLIEDSGFAPVDIGGWEHVKFMEAPRRPGAVYGEEYHLPEALAFVAELNQHQP
ncbi:MAG: NADPH-dependent F420 reductase [Ktedonobacterales bacterium]